MKNDPPAFKVDQTAIQSRRILDFSDYNFRVNQNLDQLFHTLAITVSDVEAFLFFYPRIDLNSDRFSLFNFHCFLKYTGTIDEFAHSRGASVATIALEDTVCMGQAARMYKREIVMKDLFMGAPQVIDFIGGRPDLLVVDSHIYMTYRHAHYYSGMLHEPGTTTDYDKVRSELFTGLTFIQ